MSQYIHSSLTTFVLLVALASPIAVSAETSIVFLPGHIQAEDGQVSLFADFGSIQTNGRVPVYLVNKSSHDLVLNTQDGDIYLKLQFQDSDGHWIRAQPHGYSWCGNSYVTRTVRPGYYMLVSGYQPINGEPRAVRYKLYGQEIELSSNAGDGVVDDTDIKWASNDVMSIREGSFEHVSKVALDDEPVENKMDHIRDIRETAIWELSSDRFDPSESRQILRQVREHRPDMFEAADSAIRRIDQRSADNATNAE